ncbi:MAG: hypothetical protein D6802_06525, partial [Ardenticatenia bacterium]
DEEGWRAHEALVWTQMPPRVEAIIAERIAQLPADWHVLLAAAGVAGDDFTAEVLAQALDEPVSAVRETLTALTARPWRLVQFRGRSWLDGAMLNTYRFRHALFQNYLYERLSEAERVQWHERIARILETLYRSQPEAVAPALARHFEAAHLPAQAAHYYLEAGRRAMENAAPEDALALFCQGLALLRQAPAFPQKQRQEMALHMEFRGPLLAMSGWDTSERMLATRRVYELCRQRGTELALLQALFVQANLLRTRGENTLSLQLGDQLLSLAQGEEDAAGLALAHWTLGETHLALGHLTLARGHFTQAIAFHENAAQSLQTPLSAIDLSVVCQVWLSWVDLKEGDPDQGRGHLQQALTRARALDHPLTLAFALILGGYGFHWLAREPEKAMSYADALTPLLADESTSMLFPWAQLFQGWALAESGRLPAGVAMMEAALQAWRTSGVVSGLVTQAVPLTEAYIRAGETAKAQALIRETLALMEKTGNRLLERELVGLAQGLDVQVASAQSALHYQ